MPIARLERTRQAYVKGEDLLAEWVKFVPSDIAGLTGEEAWRYLRAAYGLNDDVTPAEPTPETPWGV